jgi:phosphatidate phosphatase APP1
MPLRRLLSFGHGLEQALDALRARLAERSGGPGPLEVLAYRGHAGPRGAVLRGRVLEERGLRAPAAGDSALHNVLATWRRFGTDEVAGARVRVEIGADVHETLTDDEGYFLFRLPALDAGHPGGGWLPVHVMASGGAGAGRSTVVNVALVRVPAADAAYGVISDVDDTILRTGATSLLSVARHTLLHNAHTRRAFRGVAALYRAFEEGVSSGPNPIFYVSSSPWNLYDLLADFMEVQRIPAGPLFLQDIGLVDERRLGASSHADHKLAMIAEILETHAGLPFVLVGDSGQRDPEVYREAARLWPGRIRAIYIRRVSTGARDHEVRRVAADLGSVGVEMVLARDSVEFARHAAESGLIAPGAEDGVLATARRPGPPPDLS